VRTLLLVPIVHTPAEMGFAQEAVRELKRRIFGPQWTRRYEAEVNRFWDELEQRVTQLKVDRVYNDSLPIGGEAGRDLVEKIAAAGSRNYQLLSRLVAGGAQLEATEDPCLLQEEVDYIQRIVTATSLAAKEALAEQHKQRLSDLIVERDRYMARRIHESLRDGETGMIFLGASHDIQPFLHNDIAVVRLVREKHGDIHREKPRTPTITGEYSGAQ
jgi:hypothetical protein